MLKKTYKTQNSSILIRTRDEFSDLESDNEENPEKKKETPKKEEYPQYEAKNFLRLLKEAFDEARDYTDSELTITQWKKSKIKRFIHNGKLTDEEFSTFFTKIDANANDTVSWDELVSFMMKEMTSSKILCNTDVAYLIHKYTNKDPPRTQQHRELITQITYSPRHDEYITLSTDSIRFWSTKNLSLTRVINDQSLFKCMLVIQKLNVLAVTTSNRKLVFYELDKLRCLPASVGASPSPKEIQQMETDDALKILKIIKKKDIPLYNAPSCMTLCNQDQEEEERKVQTTSSFFIGDDQGCVEVYSLIAPTVRQGSDFKITRVAMHKLHDDCITQIEFIDSMLCYASSSLDHTLKLWRYNKYNKKFTVEATLTDTQPILGFHFSKIQKLIITFGISRDAYVWSFISQKKIFKLGGHYNQIIGITNYHTTIDVNYVVTMTNRKEFRIWDSVNFRMVREWTDPSLQGPENKYSALYFDENRRCLIVGSNYLSKWAEEITLSANSSIASTHIHQIVGCSYSDEFDQLVTVDKQRHFSVWNLWNGELAAQYQEKDEEEYVAATCLDWGKRRLYILSKKNVCTLWNFNAGDIIGYPNICDSNTMTSVIMTFVISGRRLLARAGWDKAISLYVENGPDTFDPYRKYEGHTADITALTNYSNGFVSGSANGEIICWVLDTSKPQASYVVSENSGIECLHANGSLLFCGDTTGKLFIFSLPKLILIDAMNGHNTRVISSLTCITSHGNTLFTSDTLGYVKEWNINAEDETIEPRDIQKCAREEIVNLEVCHGGEYFVTTSLDMCARLWHEGDMKYVGIFNNDFKWLISDRSTWPDGDPFIKEPKHFKAASISKELSMRTLPRVISIKKINRMPSLRMLPQIIKQQQEEKKEEKEQMSITEIGKAINSYVNSYNYDYSGTSSLELDLQNRISSHHIQQPSELRLSSRPPDLIAKFNRMTRPSTSQSLNTGKRSRLLKIPVKKTRKDKLKIPISLTY